jgi:hypothetical protein
MNLVLTQNSIWRFVTSLFSYFKLKEIEKKDFESFAKNK